MQFTKIHSTKAGFIRPAWRLEWCRQFAQNVTTACAFFVELPSHTARRLEKHEARQARIAREAHEADLASANLPTPEQQLRAQYRITKTQEGKRRAHNQSSTNLDVYLNRGQLNDETRTGRDSLERGRMRYSAGMKFFQEFRRTGFLPGFKSCLNVSLVRVAQTSPGLQLNFHAYHEFQQAAEAIHPRYRKLAIEVCCRGEWLQDIRTTIPVYRRMDALQRALDMLIDYYEGKMNPRKINRAMGLSLATTHGEPPIK